MKKSFIFIIAALLIYLAGGLVLALTSATGRYDKQDGKEQVETIPAGYQHVVLVSDIESYMNLNIELPGNSKAEYYSEHGRKLNCRRVADTLYITLDENCPGRSSLSLNLTPVKSLTLINRASNRVYTVIKSRSPEIQIHTKGNVNLDFFDCASDNMSLSWDRLGEVSIRTSSIGKLTLLPSEDYISSVNFYQTSIGKLDWGKSAKDSVALHLPEE